MRPASPTRFSLGRTSALGCTAVLVLAGGLLVATPAFAATNSDGSYSDLQADLASTSASGGDVAQLSADIDASGSTLTVSPSVARVLDLHGHTLRLDTLQLTSIASGAIENANLTIVDSTGSGATPGSGHLIVTHTSDGPTAAIEVDSGSTLTVKQAVVDATASSSGTGAGIGGGGVVDQVPSVQDIETAGTVNILDGAVVTAAGSQGGAAIGGGRFGAGGTISITQTAKVVATGQGYAAAIGSGASATTAASTITIDGYGINSRGGVGVDVTATTTGHGAAIGGGFQGAGGAIGIHDYSTVHAFSAEAGIGDGEAATGSSQVSIDGYSTVTAQGGGSGGAGIGGSNQAYGSDQVSIGGNSVVVATGSTGPGIGGERNRYPTTVTVDGASNVTATGGGNGAGIGGGDSAGSNYQAGAQLTVGDQADLTVGTSNSGISAIGAGAGSGIGSIGLSGGTLHLGSGQQITVPSGSTFTNSALVLNSGSLTTAGSGLIDNEGVIVDSGSGSVSGSLNGYAYALHYNPGTGSVTSGGDGSVFADTLQKAQVGLAAAQPSTRGTFAGWNTAADASGTFLEPSTSLSTLTQTASGHAVSVPLYAIYQLYPVLGAGSLPTARPHHAYAGSVAVTVGSGPLGYSEGGAFPSGLKLNRATGAVTGTPTTPGVYRFTVRVANRLGFTTRAYSLVVGAPLAAKLASTVEAKHAFALKLTNLLKSEPVRVVMTGPAKGIWNGAAHSGAYSVKFPHGLKKKGHYTLTVTGKSTHRVLVVHLTVK